MPKSTRGSIHNATVPIPATANDRKKQVQSSAGRVRTPRNDHDGTLVTKARHRPSHRRRVRHPALPTTRQAFWQEQQPRQRHHGRDVDRKGKDAAAGDHGDCTQSVAALQTAAISRRVAPSPVIAANSSAAEKRVEAETLARGRERSTGESFAPRQLDHLLPGGPHAPCRRACLRHDLRSPRRDSSPAATTRGRGCCF